MKRITARSATAHAATAAEGKAKSPANFTPDQEAELAEAFKDFTSYESQKELIEAFASTFGRSVRSIVAKVSRMGLYHKAEYKTKTGEKPQDKSNLADAIGAVLKLSESDADSLTKANKSALKAIFAALANSKPIDGNE